MTCKGLHSKVIFVCIFCLKTLLLTLSFQEIPLDDDRAATGGT